MTTACTAIGFPAQIDYTLNPYAVPTQLLLEGRTVLGTGLTYKQAQALCKVWRSGNDLCRLRRTIVVFTTTKAGE